MQSSHYSNEQEVKTDLDNSELALNSILQSELNTNRNLDHNLRSLNGQSKD